MEDFYGKDVHDPDLRRLSAIILKNNVVTKKWNSTCERFDVHVQCDLVYDLESTESRDIILRIGCISPEFSIFRRLSSQDDL